MRHLAALGRVRFFPVEPKSCFHADDFVARRHEARPGCLGCLGCPGGPGGGLGPIQEPIGICTDSPRRADIFCVSAPPRDAFAVELPILGLNMKLIDIRS